MTTDPLGRRRASRERRLDPDPRSLIMSDIRAVIFDMDGVLVDSEPVHVEATRIVLQAYGIRYDDVDDFFGFSDAEVFRVLRNRYRLEPDEDALASEWIGAVMTLLPARIAPSPGVPDVVTAVHEAGYRIALASGSDRRIIDLTLRAVGLEGAFEETVSAKDVGRGKPAPDIFLETARRLNVSPVSCLVVEDSRNGLLAACAAGMRCAAIPCSSTAGQDFSAATCVLPDLRALPAWLASDSRTRS